MNYKILADSSTDLSKEMLSDLNVELVPLSLELDGVSYIDDEKLDIAAYLEKVNTSKEVPKSSCPSPNSYFELMKGQENDIYVVTLSSKLSGSYNSAMLAKKLFLEEVGNKNIHVFNSKSACSGEVAIVLKIKELADKGLPFAEIVEQVEDYISEMKTLFVLENIDNLRKTGRMSLVQATIANVLNIKLFLGSNENGEIQLIDKARGIKKAINKMVQSISKLDADLRNKNIVIAHCLAEERAMSIKKTIEDQYNFKKVFVVATRGLSSNYTNIGGIVIAF